MKRKIVVEIICFIFIFLFVYAAVSKLMDIGRFQTQIGQSPLLTKMSTVLSWVVPLAELGISFFLIIDRFRLAALYCAFGMMVMFTIYIISILQFSEHIPCACGGVLQVLGWRAHLIFNVVFVLLAAIGIFIQNGISKTQEKFTGANG